MIGHHNCIHHTEIVNTKRKLMIPSERGIAKPSPNSRVVLSSIESLLHVQCPRFNNSLCHVSLTCANHRISRLLYPSVRSGVSPTPLQIRIPTLVLPSMACRSQTSCAKSSILMARAYPHIPPLLTILPRCSTRMPILTAKAAAWIATRRRRPSTATTKLYPLAYPSAKRHYGDNDDAESIRKMGKARH